ncbi:cytochrome c oxidase assembly protein [Alteromonas sp. ASW11-19]|uniref:Cytochrome c oxidase assembly protein n=1 Tax=Alteromonas salexigens TaxID=2982530 RepID=A0ABT2VUY0_9ALTE|nr:cytochrome c oxidase assembly protein [Alteromonas salexigens]MCU7556031.1 cytochrome c oxidase assembly protein [Alteromonas salexigens]
MHVARIIAGLAALVPFSSQAHSPFASSGQEAVAAGLSVLIVLVLWCVYVRGVRYASALKWRQGLFHLAMIITVFTIVGPLDTWAEQSSSAHMTQHMFMIVVIAPALAMSKPLLQIYRGSGRYVKTPLKKAFAITQYPMGCAYIHAAVIWFWHIPQFYMLALTNPWVHVFEHACFIVSAVWFWWACLNATIKKAPMALLAMVFTLMHTGFLGALLTFAPSPFYGEARSLADQQLAGLLMWVMGGLPYIIAGFWMGARWYRQLQRSVFHT